MAKPSLDDLIDSVRKGPAPDPKKVAAEKKKKERKEALKNVPVAKKKSRAQKSTVVMKTKVVPISIMCRMH